MNDTQPEAPTPRTDAEKELARIDLLAGETCLVLAERLAAVRSDLSTALNQLRQAREEAKAYRTTLAAIKNFPDCETYISENLGMRELAERALTTSAPKGEQP